MKNILLLLAIFTITTTAVFSQDFSAKKLYKNYKKQAGFKEAAIPKFLLASARLIIKNDEINTVLKAVQKSRVLSKVNNNGQSNTLINNKMMNSLDKSKYNLMPSKSENVQVFFKEKKGKVKELAIFANTGPTLHYAVVKGKMDKNEAEKFTRNLAKAGIEVEKVKDKLLDALEDLIDGN